MVAINATESSGMPALIQQYRQAGIDGTFVGAVGTILPTVFRIAGEAMTGVVSADIYFPDLPPFDGIKENLAFIDAFKKAHNQVPDKGDALGAQALFGLGERRPTPPRASTARRSPSAIRGKTIKGTIFGDMSFEANGQARHKHTLFKVTDGKTAKLEVLK